MSAADGAALFRAWAFYGGAHSRQFQTAVLAQGASPTANLRDFARIVLGVDDTTEDLHASLRMMSGFIAASGARLPSGFVKPSSGAVADLVAFIDTIIDRDTTPLPNEVGVVHHLCGFIESLVRQDIAASKLSGLADAMDHYEKVISDARA